ncbi:MAG: membrane lipoprotein lipid attachment site-containing protein [Chitinophagaceae bacterium]
MKKILYYAVIIFVLANCNTPNQAIGKPDPATNTSGTTGSANMTNGSNTAADVRNPVGTPTDTATIKKDSLPH